MEIRTLKLFRHLAGTLHFARTSQACYISPSALTRVVQRLESELGQALFFRDNRSVELTPAGLAFKTYADDVIRRWDHLKDELSGDERLHGEISLFGSVTAAYDILPGIMARFRRAHPAVSIHLETGDQALALDKLSNREADLVIAARPDSLSKDLAFLPLSRTPLVFIEPRLYPETLVRTDSGID